MINQLVFLFSIVLLVIWAYMTLGFIYSLMIKRNDLADTFWGFGFIIASSIPFLLFPLSTRGIMTMILVALWGVRLTLHIHRRNKTKKEDYRYAQWRNDWGKWFVLRSYFQVWLLQGLLMVIIVSPVLFIQAFSANYPLGFYDVIGVLLWVFGFMFEVIGDHELELFRKRNKKQNLVLQTGLWKYTRHPNYFGEVTLWWGIWLMTLAIPYGWATIIGPLTITGLILFVSGIPLLEQKLRKNPDYRIYMKKTSIFLPLPPKNC